MTHYTPNVGTQIVTLNDDGFGFTLAHYTDSINTGYVGGGGFTTGSPMTTTTVDDNFISTTGQGFNCCPQGDPCPNDTAGCWETFEETCGEWETVQALCANQNS